MNRLADTRRRRMATRPPIRRPRVKGSGHLLAKIFLIIVVGFGVFLIIDPILQIYDRILAAMGRLEIRLKP